MVSECFLLNATGDLQPLQTDKLAVHPKVRELCILFCWPMIFFSHNELALASQQYFLS